MTVEQKTFKLLAGTVVKYLGVPYTLAIDALLVGATDPRLIPEVTGFPEDFLDEKSEFDVPDDE